MLVNALGGRAAAAHIWFPAPSFLWTLRSLRSRCLRKHRDRRERREPRREVRGNTLDAQRRLQRDGRRTEPRDPTGSAVLFQSDRVPARSMDLYPVASATYTDS